MRFWSPLFDTYGDLLSSYHYRGSAKEERKTKWDTNQKENTADRKKLNWKYHSQKAYRKEQKRKTGWRARWDKFTDRLANILGICFLLTIPIFIAYMIFFDDGVSKDGIYGLWQSENHQLAISYERAHRSGKVDWDIVQDGNVLIKTHALMILNA